MSCPWWGRRRPVDDPSATTAALRPSHRSLDLDVRSPTRRTSPTVKVGSPIDSSSAIGFGGQPRRLAHAAVMRSAPSPARPCRWPVTPCPRRRCTTRAVPRSGTGRWFCATRQAVPHSMVRGAMRIAVRSGSSAGSASAIWRARSQLTRAAAMSRLVDHAAGAHVPAVGGVQIACGLQVLGDQRRVLIEPIPGHVLRSRPPRAGAARRDPI